MEAKAEKKRKDKKEIREGFQVFQNTAAVNARPGGALGAPPGLLPPLHVGKPRKLQF